MIDTSLVQLEPLAAAGEDTHRAKVKEHDDVVG